ncbi:thioredoxin-domain-containing protein [Basidiobolus meristosporus CBS 931.73]|uniref:Thioredoxin-domain-containing protein n=1 Tax=Basidiobolus meristosporus CBS 931.73 TaxID=1314790 RepID=A0A1Y1XHY5_9FUNG|nr:thioredoxin-domain-containing protein [Basidiobolus meristosporus CBS 931.73]|eukprot:ORX85368.1 thioredoxin-domain-containing protein [Basidiobolus meristosporus CBS 931.73]
MQLITSSSQFDSELAKAGKKLVVVDFFAVWCGPCKMLEGPLHELSRKYGKGAIFLQVDVDQSSDLAGRMGVRAMPTIQFFKNSSKVGEVVGPDVGAIESLIKQHYVELDAFSGSGKRLGEVSAANTNPVPHDVSSSNRQFNEKLEENDCLIQIRLMNGENVRELFKADDTIQKVYEFVASKVGKSTNTFRLSTSFPRKMYEGAELQKTLKEENLTPRGQLIAMAK